MIVCRYLDTNKGRDVGKFVVKVRPLPSCQISYTHQCTHFNVHSRDSYGLSNMVSNYVCVSVSVSVPAHCMSLPNSAKTYATEAKEFGTLADIKDAQEMAAQWLPEKKKESAPSNVRFAE